MKRTELPNDTWQHVAMDYCGVLPSGHHMLVVVDYFSRFIEVEFVKRINSEETIDQIDTMFARCGYPLSITADNARQFISQEFKEYCEQTNIRLISTIPYWPQMNGEVERQNRSLLKRLIIMQNEKKKWKRELNKYLLMYRSTKHSTTLKSPGELMFGRCIRDKLPSIWQPAEVDEELRDRDKEQKVKGKEYSDAKRKAEPSQIMVGDYVLAKRQVIVNKLSSPFETTIYKVIKRTGSEATIQSTETLSTYRRNVAHLKKLPSDILDSTPASDSSPSLQDHQAPDSPPTKRARRAPSRLGL